MFLLYTSCSRLERRGGLMSSCRRRHSPKLMAPIRTTMVSCSACVNQFHRCISRNLIGSLLTSWLESWVWTSALECQPVQCLEKLLHGYRRIQDSAIHCL